MGLKMDDLKNLMENFFSKLSAENRLGDLTEIYFLIVLEARSLRSGC